MDRATPRGQRGAVVTTCAQGSKHPAFPARRRTRRGFTLLEALMAMLVIAIIVPVAMQGISVALKLGLGARQRAQAATLARSKLDEITATNIWQTGPMAGDFGAAWPDYQWSASLQPWTDGTMQELDVKVTWTTRMKQQELVVATLVNPANIGTN